MPVPKYGVRSQGRHPGTRLLNIFVRIKEAGCLRQPSRESPQRRGRRLTKKLGQDVFEVAAHVAEPALCVRDLMQQPSRKRHKGGQLRPFDNDSTRERFPQTLGIPSKLRGKRAMSAEGLSL